MTKSKALKEIDKIIDDLKNIVTGASDLIKDSESSELTSTLGRTVEVVSTQISEINFLKNRIEMYDKNSIKMNAMFGMPECIVDFKFEDEEEK